MLLINTLTVVLSDLVLFNSPGVSALYYREIHLQRNKFLIIRKTD